MARAFSEHVREELAESLALVDVGLDLHIDLLLPRVLKTLSNVLEVFIFLGKIEFKLFKLFLKGHDQEGLVLGEIGGGLRGGGVGTGA